MITFFTLTLDAQPWIEKHYPVFSQLRMPWRWIVCEGVAANNADTSWCARIEPRLSNDGTTEYLSSLAFDARVTVLRKSLWNGKVEMCNTALSQINKPCLLWQVDSDELWTPKQIEAVHQLFQQHPDRNCAYFWCRYFVGPDIVIQNRDCYGNHSSYEWKRVWRFKPGMRFKTHEPPVIEGMDEKPLRHAETEAVGAVFDHMAYATEAQVRFKQRYYAGQNNPNAPHYAKALEGWKRLQANQKFPVRLQDFLPWTGPEAVVVRV